MIEVKDFSSDSALTAQAASDIAALLNQGISERGRARLVLTGGTLGIKILGDFKAMGLDLSNVDIFFGDELNRLDNGEEDEGHNAEKEEVKQQ